MFSNIDLTQLTLEQTQHLLLASNNILWAAMKRLGGITTFTPEEIVTAQVNVGNFSCDLKGDGSLEMVIFENMKGRH